MLLFANGTKYVVSQFTKYKYRFINIYFVQTKGNNVISDIHTSNRNNSCKNNFKAVYQLQYKH